MVHHVSLEVAESEEENVSVDTVRFTRDCSTLLPSAVEEKFQWRVHVIAFDGGYDLLHEPEEIFK